MCRQRAVHVPIWPLAQQRARCIQGAWGEGGAPWALVCLAQNLFQIFAAVDLNFFRRICPPWVGLAASSSCCPLPASMVSAIKQSLSLLFFVLAIQQQLQSQGCRPTPWGVRPSGLGWGGRRKCACSSGTCAAVGPPGSLRSSEPAGWQEPRSLVARGCHHAQWCCQWR